MPFIEETQQSRNILKIHKLDKELAFDKNRGSVFDIAIIEVSAPFIVNAYVIPAKLPTDKISVGTQLTVSGWGQVYYGILKVSEHLKCYHLG